MILVGGFLGAGKTTLIRRAAGLLAARGQRVGAIGNDQGSDLVDTRLFQQDGLAVDEVSGGCFCCRLSDFLTAADRLLARGLDVLFAEPVGSCTDLAATVVRPLLRDMPDRVRVAPLTVVIDRARLMEGRHSARETSQVNEPSASDLAYLQAMQADEADVICMNKCDCPAAADVAATLAPVPTYYVSARTGDGVEEWLADLLGPRLPTRPGGQAIDVDYERYAAAESALGWLNWHVALTLRTPSSPAALCGPLLDDLDRALTRRGARVHHLKLFDQTATGYVKASLCANGDEPSVEGALDASAASAHALIINLRAEGDPAQLAEAVAESLWRLPGTPAVVHREAFRPSPPRPEQRLALD